MSNKQKDYNILTFAYNSNTLLLIQNSRLSFLTIMPLKQHRDIEILDSEALEAIDAKDRNLINNFQAFENDSLGKQGALGAAYKVISLYKKLSPLQDFQLRKGYSPLSFLNKDDNDINSSMDFFLQEKIKYTVNECLNYNEYTKKDFLVIRTLIPYRQYEKIIPKNSTLSSLFRNLKESDYLNIKNHIDQLFLIHQQNILDQNFANDFFHTLSPHDLIDILAELNLNVSENYFNNINGLEYNIWEDYNKKERNWQLTIFEHESDTVPFVFVFNQYSISIFDPKKIGSKKIKIFPGQKIKYFWENDNTILKVVVEDKNSTTLLYQVYNPHKVEESYEKKFKYDFTLKGIPVVFNSNISANVATALKNAGFEEFNIQTEVVKKPLETLSSQIAWNSKTYDLLTQLPNLNGKLFDKDLVRRKLHAFKSILHHLDDDKQFSTVRFTFSIVLPYHKDEETFEFEIDQKLSSYELSIELLRAVSTKLTDPFSYEPFLSVAEKSMELENSEIKSLINLKYSNTYFNNSEDTDDESLTKIDNAHIYLKVKEKVQSLNIFEGPDMFNGLIIAPSGSGKSFITVNLIDGFLSSNPENLCWILDRGGSYINFTSTFGGINISLNKTNQLNCINPFVFDNYFSKLFSIEYFLDTISQKRINLTSDYKNISKEEKFKIEKEIEDLYNEIEKLSKITKFRGKDEIKRDQETNKIISTSFEDLSPQDILEIFVILLETMIEIEPLNENTKRILNLCINDTFKELILKKTIYKEDNDLSHYLLISDIKKLLFNKLIENGLIEKDVFSILSILEEYIDPVRSGKLFNGKPALNLNNLLVNIDFGEIQDEGLSNLVLSSLLLNFFNTMTSDKYSHSKKLLIIDEAHAVLNSSYISGLKSVSYLYRTARKHGGAVWLLSQGIGDFAKLSGETEDIRISLFNGIINNAGWIFLLGKHKKNDLVNRLDLNEEIANRIVTKDKGSREFYISTANVSGFATLIVSDLNYAIATTNKDEKNILKAITYLTKNTKYSLLIFASIFGKSFISKFSSVSNFVGEIGGKKLDNDLFYEKISDLFSEYSEDTKQNVIDSIMSLPLINKEIINSVIIKSEIDNKYSDLKKVINNSEPSHK